MYPRVKQLGRALRTIPGVEVEEMYSDRWSSFEVTLPETNEILHSKLETYRYPSPDFIIQEVTKRIGK